MDNPKFDSSGTHVYTLTSHISLTCIYIVGVNPAQLLDGDHDT